MLLVIINPISGKGKSMKIFNSKILRYLNYQELDNIYKTTHKEHATEIISTIDLINITNIILIGGDGLIHEVVQGLIKKDIYNIPIYIVPTGSGNGLAKNLNINNISDAIKCIMNINKQDKQDNTIAINLLKVTYNTTTKYSFLAQTWSMISDIDITTEWLRWIGDLRYYWGILKFLFKNKSVKGKFNYKSEENKENNENKEDDKMILVEGQFSLFCASNVPWISSDFKMLPSAKINNEFIDIIYIMNYTMTFFEKIWLLYYCLRGEHINKCKFIKYIRTSEYTLTELKSKNTSYIVCDGEVINNNSIHVKKCDKKLLFKAAEPI